MIVPMVFTFGISSVSALVSVVAKVFSGIWKEIHPLMWLAAIMFALYFVYVSVVQPGWNL